MKQELEYHEHHHLLHLGQGRIMRMNFRRKSFKNRKFRHAGEAVNRLPLKETLEIMVLIKGLQ